MSRRLRVFYEENPLMISSPFGGVDGIDAGLFRQVFPRLGIELEGRAVLDVGCGRGLARAIVHELGGSYTGADFVVSGAGFPLVQADAHALPFADASFDAVFCIDAFEHFPEPIHAAREFRRVLRPGGFVFLSAPNYSNVAGLVKFVCERMGGYAPNTWAPFRRWQSQEFEAPLTGRRVHAVFHAAGFTRFRRIGYGPEVGLGLFPWIDHAKMPEAVQFRLQGLFRRIGPPIAAVWPGASLHGFWKIEG